MCFITSTPNIFTQEKQNACTKARDNLNKPSAWTRIFTDSKNVTSVTLKNVRKPELKDNLGV